MCVVRRGHRRETLRHFFFFGEGRGELDKGEHSEFLLFQYCCSMHEVYTRILPSSQKAAGIGALLNFFFLGHVVWRPFQRLPLVFGFKMVDPGSIPILFATRGSHLVQHISVVTDFLSSLREFQNLWQPARKGLRTAKIRGWYHNINRMAGCGMN